VQGSDSAQVSITDVAPRASVVKSLVGLACADVNYLVVHPDGTKVFGIPAESHRGPKTSMVKEPVVMNGPSEAMWGDRSAILPLTGGR
jgi:hypothetical protein